MKSFPPLTLALIAASVLATLMVGMGDARNAMIPFLIASPGKGLSEIAAGEIWRLFTPMFLHFGVLHLLFNMMWLWDLGGAIEKRKGFLFLGAFVLIVSAASNLAQYWMTGSPFFGGMSGVVYGLLGYVWMQGRYNPRFGYALHQSTVVMMLGWFVLCWTGLLGPIANWAHTAGLVIGIAWGFIERGARS
jgi:GlpG protein